MINKIRTGLRKIRRNFAWFRVNPAINFILSSVQFHKKAAPCDFFVFDRKYYRNHIVYTDRENNRIPLPQTRPLPLAYSTVLYCSRPPPPPPPPPPPLDHYLTVPVTSNRKIQMPRYVPGTNLIRTVQPGDACAFKKKDLTVCTSTGKFSRLYLELLYL